MALKETLREAGHVIGPDHKSLLLTRIYDEKTEESEGLQQRYDFNRALVVSIGNVLKAADHSDTQTAETITVGEQPLVEELPSDHLYQPHKPQYQQQVATLIAANAPPHVRPHGQQRRLIGSEQCLEVLKQK